MSTISSTNVDRLKQQEAIAKASGFTPAAPLFALGTPVVPVGEENFQASRQEWENLPSLSEAMDSLQDTISQERRIDATVNVKDITMLPNGRITRGGGGLMIDSRDTLYKLLQRTVCPEPGAAATYLSTIPTERRANEVNEWLRHPESDNTVVLRTRLPRNRAFGLTREIYGVVTEKYNTNFNAYRLAHLFTDALRKNGVNGEARGLVNYDGRKVTLQALWHSNVQPSSVCAGEMFKAGLNISTADDGSMSVMIDSLLWRNLCLNLIIVDEASQSHGRRKHVGDDMTIYRDITAAIKAGHDSVKGFAQLWDAAGEVAATDLVTEIPEDAYKNGLPEVMRGVFRSLIKGSVISFPGLRGETAVEAFMSAWTEETFNSHDSSKVSVVNAVTRAAHQHAHTNPWNVERMEREAGRMLRPFKPVDWVDAA